MHATLIAVALLWIYAGSLLDYLKDQHYQEHFVYLWCFVLLALWRTLERPFRGRFTLAASRDRFGAGLLLLAALMLAVFSAAGSSTGVRTSLVVLLSGLSVLAVPRWSISRCMMHGALLQLCFGVPYSFYFPITSELQWGVAHVVSWPAKLGLADYEVVGHVVQFDHYRLAITADCSGLGQLLTFAGIATLGVLSSARNRPRAVAVLVLAVVLAWLSNIARVLVFVMLVGLGWTDSIDNDFWHSLLGFLVFLPFVVVLVAVLIKTHRRRESGVAIEPPPGKWRLAWLIVPVALAHVTLTREIEPRPEPAYFAQLSTPPQHELVMYAPTQDYDRSAYQTPWLIGARFARSASEWFDLLHYTTRSRSHLCVHKVADCLAQPGQLVSYLPPIEIDGRQWWRISLQASSDGDAMYSSHVYFAFEVGGERRDDSYATQFAVLYERVLGDHWDVGMTRVILPGPAPEQPSDYEVEVLTWLGSTIDRER